MSDCLAQAAEDFFMDKLKDALNENERRQIQKEYNIPDSVSINTPLDQIGLENEKSLKIATTVMAQFFDEFGDNNKARVLCTKIIGVLTSQLNSDISRWPETKKILKRLNLNQVHMPPLDTWNFHIGSLVKYSKSFLSTFVQEWYHAVLIPRLKARAIKVRILTVCAAGLVILLFFFCASRSPCS